MKVLALATYPIQAAATRYRLEQFVAPLAERGIVLAIRPFLDPKLFESLYHRRALPRTALGILKSSLRRFNDLSEARAADVVLVQREAMMFGPPLIEWLATRAGGRPMVLDLDDATYVSYTSPIYGSLGKVLKWFRKTDDLIRWARVVTCGNKSIANYVKSKGTKARIIPTVVNSDVFCPPAQKERKDKLVLGWVGTHSTFPYLESIFPVLQELAREHEFDLKIVGAGRTEISVPGVEVENLAWELEREVGDFQSFDIGLYPIVPRLYGHEWAAGKSGFKSIQYMAVGIPFVASPVGAVKEIGQMGTTHFCAKTDDEWRSALLSLMTDPKRRAEMGWAGRCHVIEHFGLQDQADKLAAALREAAGDL